VEFNPVWEAQVPLEAMQPNERRVSDRTDDSGLLEIDEPGVYFSGGSFDHGTAQSWIEPTITGTDRQS
jgi:hypothetical protein